ncbi:hypothetical protein QNI19_24605 [Cytophagaceae bacterium DM2B3-1]|uniref:Uncharacterized protein n=1 Tax=Xanthocytophaga flava TaxID=3048013 RepID=A0AAE3QSW1_9BACT|nr:hypothetical protein [Xanthocytophaga flavus]MDJ1466801.1 hypothetical protein [Xanthocytophaga flavus]MDJ1482870.1 hypothetical protein [Xanthocytophaga flavus]MDJ1496141.1 hypothetical protein [Xanthocytophaga flavus]
MQKSIIVSGIAALHDLMLIIESEVCFMHLPQSWKILFQNETEPLYFILHRIAQYTYVPDF